MLQSLRPCAMRISSRRKSWMRWLSLMRSGDPTAPYDQEGQYHGPWRCTPPLGRVSYLLAVAESI